MSSPLIPLKLLVPYQKNSTNLPYTSWMGSGYLSFVDGVYFIFAPSGHRRSEKIEQPFLNVPTPSNKIFEIEIGVFLPDLFPALNGCLEYDFDVVCRNLDPIKISVSNLMSKVRFKINDTNHHAIINRNVLPDLIDGKIDVNIKEFHEEPMRSFVTARFKISGDTAAEALDNYLSNCVDSFLIYLNHTLNLVSFLSIDGSVFSTSYVRSTFESFYFMIVGDSDEMDKVGQGIGISHAGKSILNPPNFSFDLTKKLADYLNGNSKPNDIDVFIHEARRYLEIGSFNFTLLICVITAEIITGNFVRKKLLENGVSKNKLDNYVSDYKYSMMLNVELFALAPENMKPDRELIGKIDKARLLRNNYMHNGKSINDKTIAAEAIRDLCQFVEYIKKISENTKN